MMVYILWLAQVQGEYGEYIKPQTRIAPYLMFFVTLIIGVAFYGLLAFCIYRAAKYFGTAGKEQKLMRMEMGKLAEEVRQLRQELKGGKNSNSSSQAE